MNCCGNKNDDQGNSKQHSLMMKLCCIVPIVLVAILLLVNSVEGTSGTVLTYSLLLLCPLSHLVLMPLIMRNKKH